MIPRPGFCTQAKIINVIDGDTICVEIVRRFNVRLLDIDVYEIDTEQGKAAKKLVEDFMNEEVVLFVPAGKSLINLMDVNSFNRILGEIWLTNGKNLVDILKEYNFEKK